MVRTLKEAGRTACERILYGDHFCCARFDRNRFVKSDLRKLTPAVPAIWAGFLTLLVGGPWLASGYIFGTDWPGPRRFDFPSEVSGLAPLQEVLAAVSRVTSGQLTTKLFILSILFVAALTAYGAAPANSFTPRAVASTLYLVNPFVFGR